MPPPNDEYLRESVVAAMDGDDAALFPYLPDIYRDLTEIGSSPETIVSLARKHAARKGAGLRVLDPGCGKGAVSIQFARELGCNCLGIDGVAEFIDEARKQAAGSGLSGLCEFRHGDVYSAAAELDAAGEKFDIVVLGAVGPILGDYGETLSVCANRLVPGGIIVMEDGYIPDESDFKHPPLLKRNVLMGYAKQAGLELLEERIDTVEEPREAEAHEFAAVEQRCRELIAEHPEDARLFENYIRKQKEEYEILATKLTCATMVFGLNE